MKPTAIGLFLSLPAFAGNISTTSANRYAYDANAGWIDFAPAITNSPTVGNYYLTGYAYSANYGWIHLGNGPSNRITYSQTGTDYGVNAESETGLLSGYAYAANIGWIRFNWASYNDPNHPRVAVNSGAFSGQAWSPNVGWIRLTGPKADNFAIFDTDGDNIDDAWELIHFGNLTTAGIGTDWDKDGITDASEFVSGTVPWDATSWLRITSYSPAANNTQHTITFSSVPYRLYRIWTSTTLAAGSWTATSTVSHGNAEIPGSITGTTTVICVQPPDPRRFFRVVARKY